MSYTGYILVLFAIYRIFLVRRNHYLRCTHSLLSQYIYTLKGCRLSAANLHRCGHDVSSLHGVCITHTHTHIYTRSLRIQTNTFGIRCIDYDWHYQMVGITAYYIFIPFPEKKILSSLLRITRDFTP